MNNRRRNESASMNKTPVNIALVISAVIILCGLSVGYYYVSRVYQPAMTALQDVFATRTSQAKTATSIAVSTQSAVQAVQEATQSAMQTTQAAVLATQAEQTATSARATALALPTATPQLPTCKANVQSATWMFPQPGWISQPDVAISVPEDASVVVNGRLRDQAWVHVLMDNKSGFIRRDALSFDDANCVPAIVDLHFLAGWLEPSWRVLVDDTAFVGPTRWTTDNNQPLSTISIGNESALHVSANDAFSLEVLRQVQVPAFDLHTYFTAQRVALGSYIGIRFYGRDGSYYEVRFFPHSDECVYSIYENTNVVLSSGFSKIVCAYGTYAMRLVVDEKQNLKLIINGSESTSVSINNLKGGINFSAYAFKADFNYIVVTTPR